MAEAPIDGGSSGSGGTQFSGLTHEQMLAWLDQANSGGVQAAAGRLAAAAEEIHKIADDLKIRPQWVSWKGEGADAFRGWAADLANATVRLGDFSHDSSKWMGQAATAIGTAQASIPRDMPSAKANLEAAHDAHNDPDAKAVASKSSSELAALKADREKVRLEAAAEMTKLGQAYSLSSSQMDSLDRPKFPPPPTAIQDPDIDRSSTDVARPGTGGATTSSGGAAVAPSTHSGSAASAAPSRSAGEEKVGAGAGSGHASVTPEVVEPSARMGIDSVGTLPDAPQATPAQTVGHTPTPSPTGVPSVGPSSPAFGTPVGGRVIGAPGINGRGGTPPATAGGTGRAATPQATGRSATPGMREGPMTQGPSATATGRAGTAGAPGRLPTNNGVAGGRPQPSTGRSAKGIPRGTVMGGESSTGSGRGPAGQGPVTGRPTGTGAAGTRGANSGRAVTGATGAKGGIVGGRPQSPSGRSGARSFSSGGTGLVRGQGGVPGGSQDDAHGANQTGRSTGAGGAPTNPRPGSRRDDQSDARPDYLTEDESTWQPDARRNVPPVVDDATRNNER